MLNVVLDRGSNPYDGVTGVAVPATVTCDTFRIEDGVVFD